MPICNFFINGQCRFGSTCRNDHFDLRDNIKSEVEGALKGNQWPLSCFGPFKEKPCFPYLEDQSYEEIRLLYNEAKAQGTIESYQHQLVQQINNSKQKLQSLISMNSENLNYVVQIYNGSGTGEGDGVSANSNPFSLNGVAKPNTGNSIFGKTGFGQNSFANQNQMGTSTSSIFGQPTQPSSISSIFGGNTTSTFGTSTQSIFGGSSSMSSGGSIFGGTSDTTANTAGTSLFQNQSVFGNAPAAPSIFDKPAMESDTPFNSFGQPSQPQPQPFINSTPSIFGNAQPQPAQPQQQTNSIFGNSSFTNQPTSTFFNQPQQQKPALPTQNIFGQVQPPPSMQGSIFGAPSTQSIFGSSQPQPLQQQQQQQTIPPQQLQQQPQQAIPNTGALAHSTSIFGQSSFANPPSQLAPQQPMQQPFGGNSNLPNSNSIFGNSQQQQQQQPQSGPPQYQYVDPTIYSKMEDLTEEQINAFKADTFDLSTLPTVPPPKELCF